MSEKQPFRILVVNVMLPPPWHGRAKRLLFHARRHLVRGADEVLVQPFYKKKLDRSGTPVKVTFQFRNTRDIVINTFRAWIKRPLNTLRFQLKALSLRARGSYDTQKLLIGPAWMERIAQILNNAEARGRPFATLNVHDAREDLFMALWATGRLGPKSFAGVRSAATAPGLPAVVLTTYAEMIFWKEESSGKDMAAYYRPLFHMVAPHIDAVIAPSKHCGKGPLMYLPEEKVHVVYSAIDRVQFNVDHDEAKRQVDISPDTKIVLYVGQLHWRKGPQFLVNALPEVLSAVPNSLAVFVGPDKGMRKKLEQKCAEMDASCKGPDDNIRVRFVGQISDEQLKWWSAAADVLVYPTASSRECMGMSMKECLTSGTPIVVHDMGGAPEAIRDGRDGYKVKGGDRKALSEAITKILNMDETAYRNMRAGCKERSELFDMDTSGDAELAIFRKAFFDTIKSR